MDPVKPNFFIVGAPKSGTTALYKYLREHPSVFMPDRKEPHYFAPDLPSPRYVHDEASYLSLFEAGRGRARVGEASVYYLYSRESARLIRAFRPDARIIIMVRNPVDMIHSLHSQRLYSGHEDIEDFEEALAAESDRKEGRRIPPNGDPVPCLFYREMGRLSGQLQRYLDVFPREQVHVIVYDDFARDTAGAYRKVCEFLGLDASVEPDWVTHNPNKQVRSEWLRTLLKFTPFTKQVARAFLPRSARQAIAKGLVQANTRYEKRIPLRPELRRQLQDEYESEVKELGDLLGRDLSHWVAAPREQVAHAV